MIETALWLKAIYFDSGVAQQPNRPLGGHTTACQGYHVLISSRLSPSLFNRGRFSSFLFPAALSWSRCASTVG